MRLRQHEACLCREVAGAIRAFGAGGGIGRDERSELLVVTRLVAACAMDFGDLRANLDGDLDGLRELCNVALVDAERAVDVARLLVELAGGQQRPALQLRVRGLRRNALVLSGRERRLAALAVGERELLRR